MKKKMANLHVISVWMQDPCAGLGDLIRGTMHLCDLSKQLHFKLTMDTQFHPVSKCLASRGECSDYVLQNKHNVHNFINVDKLDELRNLIQTAIRTGRAEPLLILSNLTDKMYVTPSVHSMQFIRQAVMPTPEFQAEFAHMCKLYNIKCANKTHAIIHFRVGDDDLVSHRINLDKYKECLNVIDTHQVSGLMDDTTYIISDSYFFKHFLRKVRPHLASKVIDTRPIHLSHSATDGKHDQMIADTMFDFYLLINARVIKTYTTYTWVSGFVRWVSHAFNVPLVNLNYEVGYNQMKLFPRTNSRINSGVGSTDMSMFSKTKTNTKTKTALQSVPRMPMRLLT